MKLNKIKINKNINKKLTQTGKVLSIFSIMMISGILNTNLNAESLNNHQDYLYIKSNDLINILNKGEIINTFGPQTSNDILYNNHYVFYSYDTMVNLYGKKIADNLKEISYDSVYNLKHNIKNDNVRTTDKTVDNGIDNTEKEKTKDTTPVVEETNTQIENTTSNITYYDINQPITTEVKQQMMLEAGINANDYYAVDSIVTRESNWNWQVYNTSGSGAYGLGQAKPGNKMASFGSDWETNPVTQLKWMNNYAIERYGSWSAALEFWNANNWW